VATHFATAADYLGTQTNESKIVVKVYLPRSVNMLFEKAPHVAATDLSESSLDIGVDDTVLRIEPGG